MGKKVLDVPLNCGKYRVIMEDDGKLYALRHNESWRDLCDDSLIYYMALEIQDLRAEIEENKKEEVKKG